MAFESAKIFGFGEGVGRQNVLIFDRRFIDHLWFSLNGFAVIHRISYPFFLDMKPNKQSTIYLSIK